MPSERPKKGESVVSAGAAGAGGGTLVAVLGNSLSEQNPFKPWLVLIAPSVSVLLGAIWLWLQIRLLNYLRDREIKALLGNAKNTLAEALKNPDTSERHRASIRRQLEELESLSVGRILERIKTLTIVRESDFEDQ